MRRRPQLRSTSKAEGETTLTRGDVITTLKAHEGTLRATGIRRLAVCGSTGRDEARAGSDVDLLADFDKAKRLSLIDLVRIAQQLERLLGLHVHLLDRDMLPQRVRQRVEAEAVRAF